MDYNAIYPIMGLLASQDCQPIMLLTRPNAASFPAQYIIECGVTYKPTRAYMHSLGIQVLCIVGHSRSLAY